MATIESSEVAAAATRALQDPEYALSVLRGEEDQPEVRNAILAEISRTRDAALATLPKGQARLIRAYMRDADPGDAEVFKTFRESGTPAGAFLVNLGADANAASW